MSSLIRVNNLVKWYSQRSVNKKYILGHGEGIIKAIDEVSFSLDKGEILGIIGESGCGKSTLGRLLVALEKPTDGSIEFEGQSIDNILKQNPLQFRRDCQMIFQNPFDTFDPRNSIQKILTTALKIHNIGASKEERINICIKFMEDLGIKPAEDYLYRYPHELSGGQLQRISIIRSMLLNPKLIIADEAVSMLDVSVRADIINVLLKLVKEQETAMVFISHDILTTHYISDVIAVMYLGRIVEIGKTDDVIHNPRHPYTKVLISNCASIDPLEKRSVIKISGEAPTPINTGPGCFFYPRCYRACEKCKESYPIMIEVGDEHYASCFYLE
ncbi:ABC transporter ATP-binding protein [Tissierella sp. MSJ-40]|uniref:ABC transporter ATP-binding protein n=1 Tax=Tissierella simiarum TaxID=2841534 RepID=A0ABS6E953_9FIRM|nr:ABC transporter ATP-binding protein [Tissierella simiarum]MBU5439441.1 ABC transporter ATP-binding protein [Tissierella simiarum]